jgi:hypothetical protein
VHTQALIVTHAEEPRPKKLIRLEVRSTG